MLSAGILTDLSCLVDLLHIPDYKIPQKGLGC